ncbi:DMT family transporter [Spiractinospora alimapuensis]|nr:DMT family transporter [Spiractinospora alimapuensis]
MFIGFAVLGAFFIALGAALQERDAVRAPGRAVSRISILLHLWRRPQWLLGSASIAVGVTLHLLALGGAPLTIVQPIGVSGLVFAIFVAAALNRHRVRWSEIAAGGAVTVGLVGLVSVFPAETRTPEMSPVLATVLSLVIGAVAVAVLLGASHVPPAPRALLLAAAAGTCLGATSAFARVVASQTLQDFRAVLDWLVVPAILLAAIGGLLLQNAYRTGHFSAAYSTLLLTDPVTAATIGIAVLGEQIPQNPLERVGGAAAAVLAVVGTILLTRAIYRNPAARRAGSDANTNGEQTGTGGDSRP